MPSILDVPDWLKDHPDLRARDIKLHQALKPFGGPYYTARPHESIIPQFAVKVLDPDTEEGPISERLQENPSSPNHGLPSEIIPSEPRLLVMPFISDLCFILYTNQPQSFVLDVFHQMIEGVEYLHRLRIAHLDICSGNVRYALPSQAVTDTRLVAGKVYFIDFHTSRQLALEPGRQPPIVLPPSQETKPLGVTTLDPYSFDVYCTGRLMQSVLQDGYPPYGMKIPWIPRRYAQWLVGNERGLLAVLRWLVYGFEFLSRGFAFTRHVLANRPPR